MRTGAIIQARLGSTRLPGKVLREIGDEKLLEVVVERVKKSKCLDEIIVATSNDPFDDKLVDFLNERNYDYYRGSEENVLERYVEAGDMYDLQVIVRITGDNPLVSPNIIDAAVEDHHDQAADYTKVCGAPIGVGVEVVGHEALKSIHELSSLTDLEKEHVTYRIKNKSDDFIHNELTFDNGNNLRLTVDTPEDLHLMRVINNKVGDLKRVCVLDVISFLEENPNIKSINSGVSQKIPGEREVDRPEISVIVRTFNSEETIERALKSALSQTFDGEYELLIIDDGSTDSTLGKIKQFEEDDRIQLFETSHSGPVKTLNWGIDKSNGKYYILLDADDEFHPAILEKMYEVLEEQLDTCFVYCDYYEKWNNCKRRVEVKNNPFHTVAIGVMFRRSEVLRVNKYDEELIFPEYDLLQKLRRENYDGYYLEEPLFTYHRNRNGLTNDIKRVDRGKKQLENRYGVKMDIRDYY